MLCWKREIFKGGLGTGALAPGYPNLVRNLALSDSNLINLNSIILLKGKLNNERVITYSQPALGFLRMRVQ